LGLGKREIGIILGIMHQYDAWMYARLYSTFDFFSRERLISDQFIQTRRLPYFGTVAVSNLLLLHNSQPIQLSLHFRPVFISRQKVRSNNLPPIKRDRPLLIFKSDVHTLNQAIVVKALLLHVGKNLLPTDDVRRLYEWDLLRPVPLRILDRYSREVKVFVFRS
jgi:hypothetical protein